MKKTYLYALMSFGVAACAGFTSCGDDNDWEPGPVVTTTHQISITSESPADAVIDPNTEYAVTVDFSRADGNGTLTVPLEVSDKDHFEVPTSVTFADGETAVSIDVKFKPTDVSGQYNLVLAIPEGDFNSPYAMAKSKEYVNVLVIEWELVSDKVRCYDNNGAMTEFYTSLWKGKGVDIYNLKDFMVGQDLTFEAKEGYSSKWTTSETTYYDIRPRGGSYGDDPFEWGYKVWYFSPDLVESYPMFFHNDADHYYDYVFLFCDSNLVSYIVPSKRYGQIVWYYSRYDLDWNYTDGNYIYMYFTYYDE